MSLQLAPCRGAGASPPSCSCTLWLCWEHPKIRMGLPLVVKTDGCRSSVSWVSWPGKSHLQVQLFLIFPVPLGHRCGAEGKGREW